MDRVTLRQRQQGVEELLQRMEENIAFQGRMIATLDRGGHDVKAAKMFLRQLEAKHARNLADRDRLFLEFAAGTLVLLAIWGALNHGLNTFDRSF